MNERARSEAVAQSLENSAFFMPFSANRQFKKAPRLFARAEGIHYYTPEGRQVIDGTSGLWCVNAGHCRPKIVEAVQKQVATMEFAPPFQLGHPAAFEFADRLAKLAPKGLTRVFFTNSGSESVDTALKLALAYHRVRGEGHRMRLIGRERGYHGVNFGGTAVGGISGNRKIFGALVAGVDHLRHTHDLAKNAFSRGQPKRGAGLAAGGRRDKGAATVRFRLRKSLPFDIDKAAVSFDAQKTSQGLRVAASIVLQSVLEEYESAFREAGCDPGIVLPSSLAALGAVGDLRPTMMLKVAAEATAVAVVSGGQLLLHRLLEGVANGRSSAHRLAEEIYPSLVYFQDTYGLNVEQILVNGVPGLRELCPALAEQTGVPAGALIESGIAPEEPGNEFAGAIGALL